MKTKILLFTILLLASSFITTSAQKLLISENFSTSAWETEFIRLNPTYTTPSPSATAASFISGVYKGYELFSGTIESGDGLLPCEDGKTVHNYNGSGVAWRLKKQTSGVSYLTLPTISSAGNISVHVKSGGAGTKLQIQKVDTIEGVAVATKLKELTIVKSDHEKYATQLDEIKTYWVDSRGPITLRIGQQAGGLFIKIFGFEVEEHASIPLKNSVDSATVIQTANTGNIGSGYGQYPQEAYDTFTSAIVTANAVFNNLASTSTELMDGKTAINNAITTFKASQVITALKSSSGINTQAYGVKGGIRIEKLEVLSQVSIYGVSGILIKQLFTSVDNTIVLPKGSYLVKIQVNNSVRTIKTIVR